jgi:hypothetical protein
MNNILLSEEQRNKILVEYASEICASNPIRSWNWTELIEKFGQSPSLSHPPAGVSGIGERD